MKIEVGKTYRIRSLEWIKENCDISNNIYHDEGVYFFDGTPYTTFDEKRAMDCGRLVKILKVGLNNYATIDYTAIDWRLPVEVLYNSLDILKEIKEKVDG